MFKELLKDHLNKKTIDEIGKSFDIIGSAIILKLPKGLDRKKSILVAKAVMEENKHIDRVFKKVGKTEGRERIPRLIWIAGKKDSLVLHKENGCSFYVDIKKVFFTPRLSSERLRILNLIKPEENVLDMFCGVGPYAIQIAKKAEEVYAIDINKNAIKLLEKNLKINKVENITTFRGDAKKIVRQIKKKFDRIIMNFPLGAKSFLEDALTMVKKTCVIHLYTFLSLKNGYENAVIGVNSEIKSILPKNYRITKIKPNKAGEVAPYLLRECLDIYLKKVPSKTQK